MSTTIRTAAEQDRHARYSSAVRRYLQQHPVPGVDDDPCPECGAPAGKRCPPRKTVGRAHSARCSPRVAAWLAACAARKAAAQAAGHAAAACSVAQQHGTELRR